jgi:antitoxin CcdA
MPRSCATPSATRAQAKSATNVSIRRDLLEAARASKINLSATLEQALIEKLREAQQRRWREENREAIVAYNEHVEKHGVFSDGSRSF